MKTQGQSGYRVVLVVPPFRSVVRPALGVSLLQSALQQHGVDCRTLYTNLRLADRVGTHLYEMLAEPVLVSPGDFLFSCVLFDRPLQDIERYVDEVLLASAEGRAARRLSSRRHLVQTMSDLARVADGFIEDAAAEILQMRPQLVGLTSSYQENLASIALARRLKKKVPEIVTVMGGANCGGEMGEELLRQFPELDFVGQGECDHSLVELVMAVSKGDGARPVAGILSRGTESPSPGCGVITAGELERTPFPEFGDYFEQIAPLAWRRRFVPGIVMESSRGCWWGARHRCRFCGLNGEQFAFRSKSPARFHAEMASLVQRYGINRIEMVDNIVDPRYFREVFPGLAASPPVELFWETSGSLSRSQVQALAQGGTTHIQAGLESLSEKSLRLMNKPTTSLRNIQTLKWCSESGIRVLWSHLFGIPGESEEEVADIRRIAEAIHHLDPPSNAHLIRLQRFSPYFESSDEYGLGAIAPARFYRHLYPFPDSSIGKLAFHFDSEFGKKKAASPAFRKMGAIVARWRRVHWRSHLVAAEGKQCLLVVDTRRCARRLFVKLRGNERRLFEFCEKARDMTAIRKAVEGEMTEQEVEGALHFLMGRRLMLCIDGHYLSLATRMPVGRGVARQPGNEKMPGGHLRTMGLSDVLAAFKRRTGFRWVLSAFLFRQMPLALMRWGNRLASRLLSATIRGVVRCMSTSQASQDSGEGNGQDGTAGRKEAEDPA